MGRNSGHRALGAAPGSGHTSGRFSDHGCALAMAMDRRAGAGSTAPVPRTARAGCGRPCAPAPPTTALAVAPQTSRSMRPLLRYCLPRVRHNGHGLANEIVPWARAFLAAQVLDAKLLPPAFGLNRRGYWRHFRTSPDDWIFNRAIEHVMPVIEFRETDYLAHGGEDV